MLTAHGRPADFKASEIAGMADYRIGPTTNRSTLGIMNEFSALVGACSEPEEAVNPVTSPCAGGDAMRFAVRPAREVQSADLLR